MKRNIATLVQKRCIIPCDAAEKSKKKKREYDMRENAVFPTASYL